MFYLSDALSGSKFSQSTFKLIKKILLSDVIFLAVFYRIWTNQEIKLNVVCPSNNKWQIKWSCQRSRGL